ncbi:MAG: hypothetical protein GFH27_549297n296 [Chloroflexi bacterium AL-W]|nr:hypothetical protein [Chloroflexi bacterium AL-N1]NOK68851.1 hypothetical protein [Chloroflexi bacterium AL-N10]NOK76835.1 hypothetical protein [Chloroflexi bacterium AL-N5]NOK82778.1 hypothetical protein [Chloroflexi bacterium AL-W]NOK90692.1 hypothetical protein [Chloroflexi bacterium AL-N15]
MADEQRPRVGIIGAGRVGSSLGYALHTHGYKIAAVWSRNSDHAHELATDIHAPVVTTPPNVLVLADVTLLALADDTIRPFAADMATHLLGHHGAVVHLSGAQDAAVLAPLAAVGMQTGALHPLQTFAHKRAPILSGTAFAVEADEPLHTILRTLVTDLDGILLDIPSASRALYHAAGAFTANYTVALMAQAVALLEQCGISKETGLQALLPLLRGTVDSLNETGLPNALTGPIARGDSGTVQRHLTALTTHAPQHLALYHLLGEATLQLAVERGLTEQQQQDLAQLLNTTKM